VDIQSLSPDDPRSLGRYELLGRLGRGSQGIVFLARDSSNSTQVAVKLLRAYLDGDEAARSRFLREVAAAKRVARFCTAQVLDANVAGSQPYIVSEYIPGPSLAAVIRADGPRKGGALDRIAVNTATALGAIHRAGVIHRDFKAANVLLGPDGPVVIDFGVAKALGTVERQVTLTGQSVGTPAYMAPEQFRDGPVGAETDVFAWGVTMVFAATGTLPFGDGSVPAVMYRILNEQPQLDRVNGPMRDLVTACLEKDPANRPTARDIVDQLMGAAVATDPAVATEPAPEPPPDAGSALYTMDPLHNVPMNPANATGVPAMMAAGGTIPASRRRQRGKPLISRRVLIAAASVVGVIVLAGGAVVGLKAFASPSSASASGPRNAAGAATRGTGASKSPAAEKSKKATAKTTTQADSKTSTKAAASGGSTHPATSGHASSSSTAAVRTSSGAGGSSTVTRYDAPDDITGGTLDPVGDISGIPYFRPASGDYEWLNDVHQCETLGNDGTTAGIICLDIVEDNPSGGTTYYTPVLTAYCQTMSNDVSVSCANITADFTLYGTGNVQETPEESASCGHAAGACNDVKNYFIDVDTSSWFSVSTAAGNSCSSEGGAGTDCEIWPDAISGVDIELPHTDKNVTTSAGYSAGEAIGY